MSRRDDLLIIRLSAAERAMVDRLAAARCLTRSEFGRQRLLGKERSGAPTEMTLALGELIAALARIEDDGNPALISELRTLILALVPLVRAEL